MDLLIGLTELRPFTTETKALLLAPDKMVSIVETTLNISDVLELPEYKECSRITMNSGSDFYVKETIEQIQNKINGA